MHRIISGAVAALAIGFIGGVTFGAINPVDDALPLMLSNGVPEPTMAHAAASRPIPEELAPASAEPATEPDAPVVAREAVATQNAARATVPSEGPKPQPSTPAAPRTERQRPPVILGIRH